MIRESKMDRATRLSRSRSPFAQVETIVKSPEPQKAAPVDAFVRGSSRRILSSVDLGWPRVVIERHCNQASERQESFSSHHILALWEMHTFDSEHEEVNGRLVRVTKRPGRIDFFPAGVLSGCYSSGPSDVVVCAFHPQFAKEVQEQLELDSAEELREFSTEDDGTLRSLMRILTSDVEANGVHGRLYADSLIYAMMTHILFSVKAKKQDGNVSRLPMHLLQKVTDRMRADLCADITVSALASECAYSPAHFLRLFRNATGYTPHRYLLRLRLEAAQQMLTRNPRSLIDVAAHCGFSSHAHLTRMFHKIVGVTPSTFRRSL
jgi:AraC family transcriptional regulator